MHEVESELVLRRLAGTLLTPERTADIIAWYHTEREAGEGLLAFLARSGIITSEAAQRPDQLDSDAFTPDGLALLIEQANRRTARVRYAPTPPLGMVFPFTERDESLVGRSLNNLSGISLGPYQLGRRRARGPSGAVYEAVDNRDGTPVCVKVLALTDITTANEATREQLDCARRVISLRHPSCVDILFVGEVSGAIVIVTAYAAKGSVEDELIRHGAIPVEEATRLTRLAAEGLAVAHASGLKHYNIKPSNLLLPSDGGVWLTDFRPPPLTSRRELSRGYHTDIAALALSYYRMLTGELTPSLDLRKLNRVSVPPGCMGIILRAGSEDAALRYGSVGDFAAALDQLERVIRGRVSPIFQPSSPVGAAGSTPAPESNDPAATDPGAGPEVTTPSAAYPSVGQTLGRCLLTERVGQGATGVVFRATHRSLGIPVAVKVVSPKAMPRGARNLQQFRTEARLLAQLNHPHIVRVWDFEDDLNCPYLVLEYVEGLSLAELIEQSGRVQIDRAIRLIGQVAAGLAAAYELGIVHRDVKPANILVTKDGTAKLADLGLAMITGSSEASEAMIGTVAYMSPEQAVGGMNLDHRSDIYGLGATLYHALTGQIPFEGRSRLEVVIKHTRQPVTPPHELCPHLDPAVSAIVCKMMAKQPDKRYATYDELLMALAEVELRLHESSAEPAESLPGPSGSAVWRAVVSRLNRRREG